MTERVFVPFSGFLFFYHHRLLTNVSLYQSSSPSRGFYFSTMYLFYLFVFVPFSGFLFFYTVCQIIAEFSNRLRPLLGVSIFLLCTNERIELKRKLSSSPSRGFYFSTKFLRLYLFFVKSLRPLLGVSIFLHCAYSFVTNVEKCLRPLLGVSIFLQIRIKRNHEKSMVFVPFSGFLFFYRPTMKWLMKQLEKVFVPFSGFLFFYIDTHFDTIELFMSSSPSRGFYFSTTAHEE